MKRLLATVLTILFCMGLNAKSIWQDKNPYTSEGDIKVGSVIVIAINDISDMRFSFSTMNRGNSSVSSIPDTTITGFLPKVAANRRTGSDDSTQFSGKGKISFSIAARIINRAPGGVLYTVAGARSYTFAGSNNTITVAGLVDPALIKGRTVDSNSVVDFTMEIRSSKQALNLQRPPLKKDEKAEVTLTEQEKQQIIIEYLRKMLGEITK